ncbi:MAG: hypothetical protein ACRC10_08850 [Thermoguttaceae bacterium]
MNDSLQKILEIDERHTELLGRLEELDKAVLAVLEEWTQSRNHSLETATTNRDAA